MDVLKKLLLRLVFFVLSGALLTCEGRSTALFVFGDSLFDPGNSEKLITLARADRLPYGRDLVSHRPSGRFCNGLLSSDILASLAGLPYPSAYLLDKENIISGTSFASSGAGIMNLTGYQLLQRISFSQQVRLFSEAKKQLIDMVGGQEMYEIVSNAVFLICIGNNDYLTNYFGNPWGPSSEQRKLPPDVFRTLLISIYEQNLLDLYEMGARKFALVSLSVIGCIPVELLMFSSRDGGCNVAINQEVERFNSDLLALSLQLQDAYDDAHFTFVNSYDMTARVIMDPTKYGFKYARNACCGAGPHNGLPCYRAISSVCANASEYVFWDFAHPTEALNVLLAYRYWTGTYPDVMPMNLQEMFYL